MDSRNGVQKWIDLWTEKSINALEDLEKTDHQMDIRMSKMEAKIAILMKLVFFVIPSILALIAAIIVLYLRTRP